MIPTSLGVAVVLLGILVNAFASLAEAAILSSNRLRARRAFEQSEAKSEVVKALLERPGQVLSAIIFVNVLASVVSAAVGAQLAIEWWSALIGPWALVAGIGIVLLLLLVIGEIIPKAIAGLWPEAIARLVGRPVYALSVALLPIVRALEWITGLLLRPFGWRRGGQASLLVSEEEVHLLLSVGREQGVIQADELDMIDNIFELEDTTVREVMTPRVAMVCAPIESDPLDLAKLIVQSGYSRIPVYTDTIDHIVGVVYAKDLLAKLISGEPFTLRDIAREPYIIPPGMRVDQLLHALQERKKHLAIVADEYGGVEGLVTIEDLIEEIVGEIQDEYDAPVVDVTWVREGKEVIVSGRMSLDDLSDLIGHRFDEKEVDRVGGLVTDRLGEAPEVGDTVVIDGITFEVNEVSGRGIRSVRITLPDAPREPARDTASHGD
ncbi:MAG: hemolysin family protein [Chloroflexota bacterium]|nr:hemolysin family protein [Dehalococcoidia bacterium]MDW8252589.1 hemolysin family protein [Chloroflexota bacterium]